VSFLLTQQRFSPLDTSEVKVRYDAFISYAEENKREAIQIVEAISKEGVKVFFDSDIAPGERWREVLTESLSSAAALLLCVGRSTSASHWQMQEIQAMESRTNARIIPILLPGSDPDEIPENLREIQWLDLRDGISSAGLNRLISTIRPGYRRPR
jgi:hypothetical protein